MDTADLLFLCALRSESQQRIVHQHACEPDAYGHIVAPDAVYFRRMGSGRITKPIFRRLLAKGFLRRTLAGSGEGPQDEYQLSPTAEARFETDHDWQRALFIFRQHVPVKRAA